MRKRLVKYLAALLIGAIGVISLIVALYYNGNGNYINAGCLMWVAIVCFVTYYRWLHQDIEKFL